MLIRIDTCNVYGGRRIFMSSEAAEETNEDCGEKELFHYKYLRYIG